MDNLILAVLFLILYKLEKSETWKFRWILGAYVFGVFSAIQGLLKIISQLGNG